MTPPATGPERITVQVMLTFGDTAELVTPDHDHRDPLRVPAADIARDAELPVNELPGRFFTAERASDGFRAFRLVDDPRL
ncbi:hypothetical protein [Actinomadura madurae]|uniref:hypothetical protein n=1 Tax=Actinomadura madurae TaxID=1993 RepID=UPI0020D23A4F|nr:hypothetical protein [Actinomadura madurae]MCP9947257.1 hypothetical protein [Actinomadura madurae]MCP9976494.1 hypothetical protein [Actinomadura madurae]MCQ0012012.1 hypothetical protein [Actinomadura madurae]MCQ0012688.1 hypothetical protein [Actinomadura madurae]